jgi:NADH dehydrogenase (ubiquinone) 1 alpha subcomplex subunit 8
MRRCAQKRAASDFENRLEDVNKHCLTEFRKHWECLDNNNQQLWQCRKFERPLNKCVFDNLVRCKRNPSWSAW